MCARVFVLFVPTHEPNCVKPVIPEQPGYGDATLEIGVQIENCEEGRKSHKLMHYLPPSHPRASSFYSYVDITLVIS